MVVDTQQPRYFFAIIRHILWNTYYGLKTTMKQRNRESLASVFTAGFVELALSYVLKRYAGVLKRLEKD